MNRSKIIEERKQQLKDRISTAKNNLRILEKRLDNDKYDRDDIKYMIEYHESYIKEEQYFLNLLE